MFTVQASLPNDAHDRAAILYWEAFGGKLGRVLGPRRKGIDYVRRVLDPSHAICATGRDGTLLGVAGYKTSRGALVGGGFADLRAIYGLTGAIWRAAVLSLLDRDVDNQRFLVDGIFVADHARGEGIGSALVVALVEMARDHGYKSVRLDVINTNPRARVLYERLGFSVFRTRQMGLLRPIFRFKSATTMIREI